MIPNEWSQTDYPIVRKDGRGMSSSHGWWNCTGDSGGADSHYGYGRGRSFSYNNMYDGYGSGLAFARGPLSLGPLLGGCSHIHTLNGCGYGNQWRYIDAVSINLHTR